MRLISFYDIICVLAFIYISMSEILSQTHEHSDAKDELCKLRDDLTPGLLISSEWMYMMGCLGTVTSTEIQCFLEQEQLQLQFTPDTFALEIQIKGNKRLFEKFDTFLQEQRCKFTS